MGSTRACALCMTVVFLEISPLGKPDTKNQGYLCSTVSVGPVVWCRGHGDHLEEVSTCSVNQAYPSVPTPSLESMEEWGTGGHRASCAWSVNENSLENILESSSFKLVPVIFLDSDIFVFSWKPFNLYAVLMQEQVCRRCQELFGIWGVNCEPAPALSKGRKAEGGETWTCPQGSQRKVWSRQREIRIHCFFNSFTEIQLRYHTIHPFEVYVSIFFFFRIFTELCSLYHIIILEHFSFQISNPIPVSTHSPFLLVILLSVSIDLPFLDTSYKWNHTTCSLLWLAYFI